MNYHDYDSARRAIKAQIVSLLDMIATTDGDDLPITYRPCYTLLQILAEVQRDYARALAPEGAGGEHTYAADRIAGALAPDANDDEIDV